MKIIFQVTVVMVIALFVVTMMMWYHADDWVADSANTDMIIKVEKTDYVNLPINNLTILSWDRQILKEVELIALKPAVPQLPSSSNPFKRFAYVTILHGIDEGGGYKGYLYNILTIKSRLRYLGSTADIIAMIGFTTAASHSEEISKDIELLRNSGVKLHYLPRLRDPQLHPKVNFMEMALLKVTPWKFTEYSSIQFIDADVLPHKNMDCLFHLHRNSFNIGSASPLNSGWYLAIPNIDDYEGLVELARSRMMRKWNETLGWGTPITPNSLFYRGSRKAVTTWNFNGASLDQGLLTHYFVLQHGRVQLFDSNLGYKFDKNFSSQLLNLKDVFRKCDILSPVEMFYHYTGRNKPWLNIDSSRKDRALKYWINSFDDLKLNITSAALNAEKLKPPLGYFYPNK